LTTEQAARIERVTQSLAELRAGKMVILVDDEDRENEGDLCMIAERVTPEAINFMAKWGRGLICLTMTEERADRLQLPLLQRRAGGSALGTAFTVSIEARQGVTTGISAADRAHTILTAVSPHAKPDDLITPGHIFPLRAKRGGVLVRTGQTEGSVDLARLAGAEPAGVICEIMNDDGSMARMQDLVLFGKQHGLLILSVADIIEYRLQHEQLVEKTRSFDIAPTVDGNILGTFQAALFQSPVEPTEYLALWRGDLTANAGPIPLVRVQTASVLGDVFGATRAEGGVQLHAALRAIDRAGCGVLLYVYPTGRSSVRVEVEGLMARLGTSPADSGPTLPAIGTSGSTSLDKLRDFGLGAQVLRALGVSRMRLLTNSRKRIAGLQGYGLVVVEVQSLT
jgi:3,4-dihydroxy 2-butanone 4-phosphate synthase/GTP cyclohydrolase II